MSTTTNTTGGPAFPIPKVLVDGWAGMTLRDYFAASVQLDAETSELAAIFGDQPYPPIDSLKREQHLAVMRWRAEVEARWRYMKADAMLRARAS